VLALLLVAALAQSPAAPPVEEVPVEKAPLEKARAPRLKWNPAVDLPVTGALGLGWLVSEFAVKKAIAPATCRWCVSNNVDDSFRSLFQTKIDPSGGSLADDISNVTWISSVFLTLGIQTLLAARDGEMGAIPVDALLVFEAVFVAMALNQMVKFAVGRERPFVSDLREDQKGLTHSPSDNNLAFFSGHATFTMSLAVAAGTITRLRGYRMGWIVWAVGIPLALSTGVLRLAAGKHNFTDVVVGWAVGAGIGFGIPWFFHNVENPLALRVVPAPGGIALAGRF
jgi:membrane-associated phospholipid phosphatase